MSSISSFVSGGPYLHNKAYHFRQEVSNIISSQSAENSKVIGEISVAMARLQSIQGQLQAEASAFLAPWSGDHVLASKELFGTKTKNNDMVSGPLSEEQMFQKIRGLCNQILNSYEFVSIIKRHKKNEIKDSQELQTILTNMGVLTNTEVQKAIKSSDFNQLISAIGEAISQKSGGGSRVSIKSSAEQEVYKILQKTKQQYFQNIDSLKKQLGQGLKKQIFTIDWNAVYQEFSKIFLNKAIGNQINEDFARNFINGIRVLFISEGQKLRSTDTSNISGAIAENLEISILNQNQLKVSGYSTGDMNEEELFKCANDLAAKLNITQNQIKEMPQRKGTAQQSGSDWILINKNGMMVRAQVKNSVSMVEELRSQGGRYGQTLKLQDEILYPSFKNNLQLYSQASEGLSDQDWEYLDYLIANLLWIRSGNAVTKDKGSSYSSGVSGIQQIINDLLSQELGYFLGISFDPIQKSQAVSVMLGGSNIFFVINNIMLYPTWKLVENIVRQLQKAQNYLMKIHVSLSAGSLPNRSSFIQDLQQAQQDNTGWQLGDPYGDKVLTSGKNYGQMVLDTAKVRRVNLNMNAEKVLEDFFGAVLSEMVF